VSATGCQTFFGFSLKYIEKIVLFFMKLAVLPTGKKTLPVFVFHWWIILAPLV
jgi:hypothetical protein